MTKKLFSSLVYAAIIGIAGAASAAPDVKIGATFPLSGNSGNAGKLAVAAIEVAAEIINNPHPGFESLPLGAGKGLPNLGGAKIKVIPADHQGNPSEGQSQTLRLITQEKVAGIVGSYQSAVAVTSTATAERYGVPFVVGDSVAANITTRGFKWTFRTTPVASDFANLYMVFLNELKSKGQEVNNIAVVFENTDYGVSVAGTIREIAKSKGFNVVADIAYNANGADVSAQVLQLKDKKPDVVIFISYTSDAILYMKTFKSLDYMPKIVIGDNSGFSDPAFIKGVGELAQGAFNRSAWGVGPKDSVTWRINEMYKAKTGQDMDDTSGRDMQAFFVLADAINRAGSTKPEAVQAALQKTDLKADQLMMGYKGVKFDATGQNTLASAYMIQLIGNGYIPVYPESAAQAKPVVPFKGWK
jgi:branched-chain amino acid transport system substrate-binding protein